MLKRNVNLLKSSILRACLTRRNFSVLEDEDEQEEKIFISQKQVDYEKERRFLRDGKSAL
jgi:hypothetical protein